MKYLARLIIFGLVGLMAAGHASLAMASEVTGSLSNAGAPQQTANPNTIASPLPVFTNQTATTPPSASLPFTTSWLPQNVNNDALIKAGFVAILMLECLVLLVAAMAKRRRRKFMHHPTPAK